MIDIDPRLDSKLRAKYERIEAENPPQGLIDFDPSAERPRSRTFNLLAGVAGIAVVAAGVAVFAVELNGHHDSGSPIPGGQSAGVTGAQPARPILGAAPPGSPLPRAVLIKTTYGSGTKTFPTVTVGRNEGLGIQFGCIADIPTPINDFDFTLQGKGVPALFNSPGAVAAYGGCTNPRGSSGMSSEWGPFATPGGRVTIRLTTDPAVRWVIRVYEYPPTVAPPVTPPSYPSTTPPFLGGPAPAGDKVLIPVTYGTGPMTLPSFTETPNVSVQVELGCLSTSPSVTSLTVNYYDPVFAGDTVAGRCFGGTGGGIGSGSTGFDGTVTMKVEAAPTEKWVILVWEGGP